MRSIWVVEEDEHLWWWADKPTTVLLMREFRILSSENCKELIEDGTTKSGGIKYELYESLEGKEL